MSIGRHPRRVLCALASTVQLVALLGCARTPEHPFTLAPGRDGRSAPRVLLARVNALAPLPAAELGAGAERVFVHVREFLAGCGISGSVVDASKLLRAALQASRNTGQLSVDLSSLPPSAIRELLAEGDAPFDALVLPEIVIRRAELNGQLARWDGVMRVPPGSAGWRWSGTTSVASLRVQIFAADGERIFEGFGGLDVLFRPVISEKRMVPVENLLANPRNLREGVAVAFHPYLDVKR